MSSSINIVKKSCNIGDFLASKLLYFVDDNGIFNPSYDFKKNNYDKLKKDKRILVDQWLYRVFLRNVTLSNNCKNELNNVSILTLFNDTSILNVNSIYDVLYPILNKQIPIDIIQNSFSMPKCKRVVICGRNFKAIKNIDDSYIIYNKPLYNNPLIKTVISMVYVAVKEFIIRKNDPKLTQSFLEFYPDPFKPRECTSCMYEKGTKQGFIPHVDIVSFCTVILAIKGDSKEKDVSLHISLSDTKAGTEKRICPLNDGQYIIFERLFHSLVPSSNREFTRISWIQTY